MKSNFNNYSLSNEEIEKILKDFDNLIKYASKFSGEYKDECAQNIRLTLFYKLSRNRK